MHFNIDEKEIDELIQKTIDKFNNIDKSKLKLVAEKEKVKASTQEIPDEPLLIYGESIYPLKPEELWKMMFISVEESKEINPHLISRKMIHEFSSEKVVMLEVYTAGSIMISDREFIYVNAIVKKGEETYLIKKSLENVSEATKNVRAMITNVYHFKPQKDGQNHITSITQLVFGGWLPQWLIDKSTLDSPFFVIEANDFLKKNKK